MVSVPRLNYKLLTSFCIVAKARLGKDATPASFPGLPTPSFCRFNTACMQATKAGVGPGTRLCSTRYKAKDKALMTVLWVPMKLSEFEMATLLWSRTSLWADSFPERPSSSVVARSTHHFLHGLTHFKLLVKPYKLNVQSNFWGNTCSIFPMSSKFTNYCKNHVTRRR